MLSIERWHRQTKNFSRAKRPLSAPVVLTENINGVCFVSSTSCNALSYGITPGMPLANARALEPTLQAVPADTRADSKMLESIADWANRYTPWVSICGCDGLWLDISGCAHLLGGEQALVKDLAMRLKNFGFTSHYGVADTPGAAWAVAHYGKENKLIVPSAQRSALSSLPVVALRIGDMGAAELIRLGIRNIGDLYVLPRAALVKRFGKLISKRLDQALGRLPEPISPRRQSPKYRVTRSFFNPINRVASVEVNLFQLLNSICSALEAAGQGVRRLSLDLFLVDGVTKTLCVGTVQPIRDSKRIAELFTESLSKIDAGFGIETMILSACVVEPLTASQTNVLADEIDENMASLAPLLNRLGGRLDFERVTTFVPRASHLPDRAVEQLSVFAKRMQKPWPEMQIRPLVLLYQPEFIESIAGVSNFQPPKIFRWRNSRYSVRSIEGPERIAPEWWRCDSAWAKGFRDYWRIEEEEGHRFWLFREGKRGRQSNSSRWYLHGLFA